MGLRGDAAIAGYVELKPEKKPRGDPPFLHRTMGAAGPAGIGGTPASKSTRSTGSSPRRFAETAHVRTGDTRRISRSSRWVSPNTSTSAAPALPVRRVARCGGDRARHSRGRGLRVSRPDPLPIPPEPRPHPFPFRRLEQRIRLTTGASSTSPTAIWHRIAATRRSPTSTQHATAMIARALAKIAARPAHQRLRQPGRAVPSASRSASTTC
jgi:hypothetical protein